MPKSLTPRGIERLRDSPDRRARDAERLQTYRNMLGNNIIPNTAYSKCHAAAYHRWDKQVRQVIEAMDHTFRWGIYDRAPLNTWSTDRITLLGDAAHAVTPHLGQGANQAVEDAITLAVLLQDAQAADIPVRLRRYEDLRIERTRQVHDGSREAGALYRSTEVSGPTSRTDRRYQRPIATGRRGNRDRGDRGASIRCVRLGAGSPRRRRRPESRMPVPVPNRRAVDTWW